VIRHTIAVHALGSAPSPLSSNHARGVEMESNERLTVTVPEAATILGISRSFAYELIGRGELPVVRFGRRVVVPRRALETLLDVVRPTSA
jgi:excisionase family DNA binding protein